MIATNQPKNSNTQKETLVGCGFSVKVVGDPILSLDKR